MRRRTKGRPTRRNQTRLHNQQLEPEKLPFIAHVHELRKRLFYVAVSVILLSLIAASVRSYLTKALLSPAGKQQFIYTAPGGGFDFVVRLCLYTGIIVSMPVIVYNLLRYIEPVIKKTTMRFMLSVSAFSGVLAGIGIVFGYLVGLPAGLHFLLHGFLSSTPQIKALISIQSYLSFVVTYLLGSALLFQVPLIFVLINKFKPLNPRKLMSYQRWVILLAFIIGAVISPSPDVRSQTIMSVPIILMYEISVIIIWFTNRKHQRPKKIAALLQQDAEARAARLAHFQEAQVTWQHSLETALPNESAPTDTQTDGIAAEISTDRPHQYLDAENRSYAEKRQIIIPAE